MSFGTGCAGSAGAPSLSAESGLLPWIGEVFELVVTNVPPGQPVTLLLGGSSTQWGSLALPYSLAWLGMPACELSVSPDVSVPLTLNGGAASIAFQVPAVAAILGQPGTTAPCSRACSSGGDGHGPVQLTRLGCNAPAGQALTSRRLDLTHARSAPS